MTCQLKILIHSMKVEIKEDHKLEEEEEEIMWIFLILAKHTMVATMVINKGIKLLIKSSGRCLASRERRRVENLFMVRSYSDIVKVKLVIVEFLGYAFHW
ncbi:hypothetical protein M9H77_30637 [Catharanthus roseus]|uniref:Uncharacterized protein n=1 Tax=Catharanthus roseus TaxID=4058 RepID=A0ACB9ZZN5_CATRO|nr:hypothetical protein M9H77_30637 [Catharanthus roseus]